MSKIKKVYKQLIVIFLLLIISVCFCGCGQINSSIISNEDGSVDEIVNIKLDADKISELGYDEIQINELKLEIQTDAQTQALKMQQELNNKIILNLSITESKADKEILNSYYNGISVKESKWENNSYSIKIKFKNIDVYKYYYNIADGNVSIRYIEKHFLYNKIYWHGSTMYIKHRDLYNSLKTKYQTEYPELINCEQAELTYTCCSNLRRQHSDADYIQNSDGKYYHTWIIDVNNPDQEIMFYYNVANTYNWMLLALIISLCVLCILCVVIVIKNYINKKHKIDSNNK